MAYCGMAAALSIAFMLLGAVIPIFMYIAPAIASFLVATVCVECGKTLAWTAYGAVSLLSLLFVPDKEVALTFVFLLGYYPLVKPKFEHIRPALLRGLCKPLPWAMWRFCSMTVPCTTCCRRTASCGSHGCTRCWEDNWNALKEGMCTHS